MKKFLLAVMSLVLACGIGFAAVGCNNGNTAEDAIVVITREPGSGTRSAFIELTGIEQDDTDRTIATADIAENTGSLVSLVSRTECAIGYASFGSVVNDESIKMISVDGTAPTTDTIKAGDYAIQRPFNIAYKTGSSNDLLLDFVEYICSTEGQAIVAEENYIPLEETEAYEPTTTTTKRLTVGGSSSVSPVMEKLIEGYKAANAANNAVIQLQESDSTAGMNGAISGTLDIGMASRAVSDSEKATLTPVTIATDGIAVIVNPSNPCTNLTLEQICNIYIGQAVNWSDVGVTFAAE